MNAKQTPEFESLNAVEGHLNHRLAIPAARRLHRAHAPVSFWFQWACLVGVILCSYYVAAQLFGDRLTLVHKTEILVSLCIALIVYPKLGIFRRLRQPKWATIVMSCSWLAVVGCTYAALFSIEFVGRPDAVFLLGSLLVLIFQPAILLGGYFVVRRLRSSRHQSGSELRCVVVGNGPLGSGLVSRLERNPYIPDVVVGFIGLDAESGQVERGDDGSSGAVLGQLAELEKLVLENRIDRVYVALPIEHSGRLLEVQALVQDLNTDVVWVPDILSLTLLNPGLKEISGYPLLSLSESPMGYFGNAFAKSLFDVIVASLMLIVLSPIMLGAAIAIRMTSPGPVLYWQYRHGWDGSVFRIYKFRSMVVHQEDSNHVSQATKNDARVTRVGRWLRRTSIDELPQLFNVLGGTMSLVGPRPHAVAHNQDYAQEIKSYMQRHRIKPGITGLAQINGLRGETDTLDKMRARVEYDLAYINDWSLWRDLIIVLRTPISLLANKSVY